MNCRRELMTIDDLSFKKKKKKRFARKLNLDSQFFNLYSYTMLETRKYIFERVQRLHIGRHLAIILKY